MINKTIKQRIIDAANYQGRCPNIKVIINYIKENSDFEVIRGKSITKSGKIKQGDVVMIYHKNRVLFSIDSTTSRKMDLIGMCKFVVDEIINKEK